MKVLISSLLATSFAVISPSVLAKGYATDEMKERVSEMDDNSDQKITFKEFFQESVTDNVDFFDRNKDGYITEGEVANEITEDLQETVEEMNELGVSEKNINKTIVKTLKSIDKRAEAIVDAMDKDGDNLVEANELRAYQRKKFNKLDTNNDGVISKADLVEKKKSKYKGYPIHRE